MILKFTSRCCRERNTGQTVAIERNLYHLITNISTACITDDIRKVACIGVTIGGRTLTNRNTGAVQTIRIIRVKVQITRSYRRTIDSAQSSNLTGSVCTSQVRNISGLSGLLETSCEYRDSDSYENGDDLVGLS